MIRGRWQAVGWIRGLVFAALSCLFASQVQGQALDARSDPSDRFFSCLTPASDQQRDIAYPARELQLRSDGTVRVRLTFTAPDEAPRVEVLFSSGENFEAAVLDHIHDYRLPCFPAGHAPLVAIQEFGFDFRGAGKVYWAKPQSTVIEEGDCEVTGFDSSSLRDPDMVRSRARSSTVLVEMQFDGEGKAPSVKVLNPLPGPYVADEVIEAVRKLRVTCKASRTWPLKAVQSYRFRRTDTDQLVLNDMSLKSFVQSIDHLEKHQVRFDLSSMSCPFAVQLRLYQPYAKNSVGEVGKTDPNRAGFIAWLTTVSLRIPDETLNQVLGDTIRISVPCGVLDLTS